MPLTIRPTEATLGAILTGVDLAALDDVTWREVEDAFHKYAVLIFPGQTLSAKAQIDFAMRFGEIEVLVDRLKTIPVTNKAINGELMNYI